MDLDLNDILVFTAVVEEGSFTGAGKRLNLAASAVSRRVARLEERLGFVLIHRTTRSLGLTPSGRIYYERTARIAQDVEDASRALDRERDTPAGLLRITAPPDDGGVIWSMLRGFVANHPKVGLEVIHTLDYLDLVDEGIDLALRGGNPPDSTTLVAEKLIVSRMMLVASPDYLARRGTPKDPEDLEHHDCIAMDNWSPNAVRGLEGDDGVVKKPWPNRIRSNRLETTIRAAVDGFGIAPTVGTNAADELDAGRLVEVLPGVFPGEAVMWAVYPKAATKSAALRALLEHLREVAPTVST